MKKIVLLLAGLFLAVPLLASASPGASTLSPEEIARRLQATYEKTTSMSARFRQITSVRMSQREKRGSGTVLISKPGRMRWDYLSPSPQVIVSDGKTVIMYFKHSNQMIVTPATEYLQSDITYSFFTGKGNILRDFKVMPAPADAGSQPGSYVIKLVPRKPNPQIAEILVWADRSTFLIDRLRIIDQFGSVTDLFFSGIKTDVKIPASLFTFTPPPGTEIIHQ